jgi:hypothetical protein
MTDDRNHPARRAGMPPDVQDWSRRQVLQITMLFDELWEMAILLNRDLDVLARMENDQIEAVVREARRQAAME